MVTVNPTKKIPTKQFGFGTVGIPKCSKVVLLLINSHRHSKAVPKIS
jgi:hypothetical protein